MGGGREREKEKREDEGSWCAEIGRVKGGCNRERFPVQWREVFITSSRDRTKSAMPVCYAVDGVYLH